jgi:hypothetical protein
MPEHRPKRRAAARFALFALPIVVPLAVVGVGVRWLAAAPAPTAAADDGRAPCATVAQVEQFVDALHMKLVALDPAQAAAARNLFFAAALTTPRGDDAAIALKPDGSAYLFFLDRPRGRACDAVEILAAAVAFVLRVDLPVAPKGQGL